MALCGSHSPVVSFGYSHGVCHWKYCALGTLLILVTPLFAFGRQSLVLLGMSLTRHHYFVCILRDDQPPGRYYQERWKQCLLGFSVLCVDASVTYLWAILFWCVLPIAHRASDCPWSSALLPSGLLSWRSPFPVLFASHCLLSSELCTARWGLFYWRYLLAFWSMCAWSPVLMPMSQLDLR